jgi:hypothetical protein
MEYELQDSESKAETFNKVSVEENEPILYIHLRLMPGSEVKTMSSDESS